MRRLLLFFVATLLAATCCAQHQIAWDCPGDRCDQCELLEGSGNPCSSGEPCNASRDCWQWQDECNIWICDPGNSWSDSFDRGDDTNLGADWTDYCGGSAPAECWGITSNEADLRDDTESDTDLSEYVRSGPLYDMDASVDCTISFVGIHDATCGVTARISDDGDDYYACVIHTVDTGVGPVQTWEILEYAADVPSILDSGAFEILTGVTYAVRIVASGSSLSCYAGGSLQGSASDSTLTGRYSGIIGQEDAGAASTVTANDFALSDDCGWVQVVDCGDPPGGGTSPPLVGKHYYTFIEGTTTTKAVANAPADTLAFTSSDGSTEIDCRNGTTPDSCDITSLLNIFSTIDAPAGTDPVADSSSDTLVISTTDGTIIATGTAASDTLDFAVNPAFVATAAFVTHDTPSGTDPVADSSTDTLTWLVGTGISITGDSAADSITVTNTEPSSSHNAFSQVNTPAGGPAIADSSADTLNVTQGQGITIIGDAGTDSVDISTVSLWFSTIDAPAGTDPSADTESDTLVFSSADSSITITGTAASDTIDLVVNGSITDQNLFETIATASGTSPVADSPTDSLLMLSPDPFINVIGDSTIDSVTIDFVTAAATDDTYQEIQDDSGFALGWVREEISLIPSAASLPASGGAGRSQTDGTNVSYTTMDFDAAAEEDSFWSFVPPEETYWTDPETTVEIFWVAGGAIGASDTVRWTISCDSVDENEAMDSALGTTATEDHDPGAASSGDMVRTVLAADLDACFVATDQVVNLRLARNGDHVNDDYASDARVVRVVVRYWRNLHTDNL